MELAAANREIEALRRRLQELEMSHLASINPGLPTYKSNDDDREARDLHQLHQRSINRAVEHDRHVDVVVESIQSNHRSARLSSSSVTSPCRHPDPARADVADAAVSPLRGCKCRSCMRVNQGDSKASRAVPPRSLFLVKPMHRNVGLSIFFIGLQFRASRPRFCPENTKIENLDEN